MCLISWKVACTLKKMIDNTEGVLFYMESNELIKEYILAMGIIDMSKETIRIYEGVLKVLSKYMREENIVTKNIAKTIKLANLNDENKVKVFTREKMLALVEYKKILMKK